LGVEIDLWVDDPRFVELAIYDDRDFLMAVHLPLVRRAVCVRIDCTFSNYYYLINRVGRCSRTQSNAVSSQLHMDSDIFTGKPAPDVQLGKLPFICQ
jgi:hypothetical protein